MTLDLAAQCNLPSKFLTRLVLCISTSRVIDVFTYENLYSACFLRSRDLSRPSPPGHRERNTSVIRGGVKNIQLAPVFLRGFDIPISIGKSTWNIYNRPQRLHRRPLVVDRETIADRILLTPLHFATSGLQLLARTHAEVKSIFHPRFNADLIRGQS